MSTCHTYIATHVLSLSLLFTVFNPAVTVPQFLSVIVNEYVIISVIFIIDAVIIMMMIT